MLIEWVTNAILIIILLGILFGVALAIIKLIIGIKCYDLVMRYWFFGGNCWGMKGCGNDNCCLRYFCIIYHRAITPEDVAKVERELEKRRKELDTKEAG